MILSRTDNWKIGVNAAGVKASGSKRVATIGREMERKREMENSL